MCSHRNTLRKNTFCLSHIDISHYFVLKVLKFLLVYLDEICLFSLEAAVTQNKNKYTSSNQCICVFVCNKMGSYVDTQAGESFITEPNLPSACNTADLNHVGLSSSLIFFLLGYAGNEGHQRNIKHFGHNVIIMSAKISYIHIH